MNEQTVAASSPADVDVFRGEQPALDEYNTYRQNGELPARFKPAEPADTAPADPPKEVEEPEGDEPESGPESDPEETQEKPPKGSAAEKRIKQLLARVKELERNQPPAAKQDVNPGPSPAQPQQPQYTRPKPTAEDKAQDGSPKYGTYEDFVEELADWKAEQRWVGAQREQIAQAQAKELTAKVADAHARYGDAFEASRDAFTKATMGPHGEPLIPVGILSMVSDSDILADLVHKIGSDPDDLNKFVRMAKTNPRQAILHIAQVEGAIKAELDGTTKSVKETPAPPKTQAPKPPSPVGGTTSRAFDVSDDSLSPDEWMRKRNKQIEQRKGR
jgi:hypothetical protein